MNQRARVQQIAEQHLAANNPLGWFEPVYQAAGSDSTAIPWADLRPHPKLSEWLASPAAPTSGQRALVVGCGLGDDAEALAAAGLRVTAFDLAPTAIDWCRRRFPDSRVEYRVADLLALPADWRRAFDLVVEIYTLQSLPTELRNRAVAAVADCVAVGGQVIAVCRARDAGKVVAGPPWPLTRGELSRFATEGLSEVEVTHYADPDEPEVQRFWAVYRRD